MDRFLRRVTAFVVVGAALASVAMANVPVPELSTVPRCLAFSPNGALAYKVTIVGLGGPVASASVELRFNTPGDTLICWCSTMPGPRPRSIFGTTNGSGVAQFGGTGGVALAAGGCLEYGNIGIPGTNKFAGEIFANGVKMQEFGTVSPDAVDPSGILPTNTTTLWNPGGHCSVGLADAVQHTTPLAVGSYEWCTDINCDKTVGLADGTILTPFLAQGASCVGDAGP